MPENNKGQKTVRLLSDRDIAVKAMKIFGMETEEPQLPETLKFLGNKKPTQQSNPFAAPNEPML